MKMIKRRYQKYLAIFIAILILAPLFSFAVSDFAKEYKNPNNTLKKETVGFEALSSDDKKIVNDISNMTGAKTEEILQLKTVGKTWNDVLDMLKKRKKGSETNDKEQRSSQLAKDGLKEDYLKKIKAEGFNDQEINEAKMFAERVVFQLKEITTQKQETLSNRPTADSKIKTEENDDISSYSSLLEKFDSKFSVYILLKLKKEFGNIESAMDEYLLSLQIGVDLYKYLVNKDEYKKDKEEKSRSVDTLKIITLAKIESKMLEKIQNENNTKRDKAEMDSKENKGINPLKPNVEDKVNRPPLPEVEDPRPKNPAEDVMKEINEIKNKSLNPGGDQ